MCVDVIVEAVANAVEEQLEKNLQEAQLIVLKFCLQDTVRSRSLSYQGMADESGYAFHTMRCAGSELFQILSDLVGQKVSRKNCNDSVRRWHGETTEFDDNPLFGRQNDLRRLLEAISSRTKRLICVYGPPGIGKKYIVRMLFQQMVEAPESSFTRVIPCNISLFPTVDALYHYVRQQLNELQAASDSAAVGLTSLLQQHPIFLQLHNTDSLYDPDYADGRFRQESCCYENWLHHIRDQSQLRGCVILISRMLPSCLKDEHHTLYCHALKPLQKRHALALLRQKGLKRHSRERLEELAHACGHIPDVLAAVARRVSAVPDGVADFFTILASDSSEADRSWEDYLSQLTRDEQTLLGWLLLYPRAKIRWTTQGIFVGSKKLSVTTAALVGLRERGLLTTDVQNHPKLFCEWVRYFVARHVTSLLLDAYRKEQLYAMNDYPLMMPRAPLWHSQEQKELVIQPLDERLRHVGHNTGGWTKIQRAERFQKLLLQTSRDDELSRGYAAGNILTIAASMGLPLSKMAFSEMTIRNAALFDLSSDSLHGLRIQDCKFVDSVLPVPLRGQLVTALSPEGKMLVVGDAEGHVCCWQRQTDDGFYALHGFIRILRDDGQPLAIRMLSFGNELMLGIVAESEVYRWWLGLEQELDILMSLEHEANSIVCGGDEFVAVGLENGDIQVWQEFEKDPFCLRLANGSPAHRDPVRTLAVNLDDPASGRLMSIGYGDRILIWNLWERDTEPEVLGAGQSIYYQLICRSEGWQAVILNRDQHYIRLFDESWQHLPYEQFTNFCFNPNGNFFAVRRIINAERHQGEIEVRRLDFREAKTIDCNTELKDLQLSNNGRWLMTIAAGYPHKISLWDTQAQKVCWTLSAVRQSRKASAAGRQMQLINCEGLLPAEAAFWSDYGVVAQVDQEQAL
ncbi:MAG: AAA family ATPase [Leptolyngbyaceae cyanobacterium]